MGPARGIDYQLEVSMVLTDECGGGSMTANGSGTITAYEGARYGVAISRAGDGNWVASLEPLEWN